MEGSPTRHAHVRRLFEELVELEPDTRRLRLEALGREDAALRAEVEAWLEADGGTVAMLDDPVRSAEPDRHGPDLTGRLVGRYEVGERLGAGGMGVVYRARDLRLGRTVALKFLPPHIGPDPEAKRRFTQEAQAASRLDHPNICTIYEIDEAAEGLYIAMACVEGETLKARIARGPLPPDDAAEIAAQMASGLAAAHAAGIVHRDVKPANVALTEAGQVKLLDFGIAKMAGGDLTRTGAALGTVAYMSPEQARGEDVDARTDVWALGVVLYEMLTGERPFRGEPEAAILYAIRHDEPAPIRSLRPAVPEPLAAVVERALAKDAAGRYPSMDALLGDLRRARAGERLPPRRIGRPRGALYGFVVLVLALLALALWRFNEGRAEPVRSVAVLPIQNLTAGSEEAMFADGMTEAITTNLGSVEALRVISRTSAMRYRGTDRPIREVAQELGVDAVVEGAVRSAGGRVAVTVQLIEAASDRILWAGSYERPLRDVLQLQRQVALDIAREVAAELRPAEAAYLAAAPAVAPDAYQQYVLGLHYRNQEAPESWRQAARHFEAAVAVDSSFAAAYAGQAEVYTQLGERWAPAARQAIERALALDPRLPDALVALGLIREMLEWDWAGAEEAFRRAVTVNPSDAEAHHELGQLLMRMDRFEEALAAVERSVELDPLSTRFRNGVADIHLFSRHYPEAIALLEASLRLDPANGITYWRLGLAHLGEGRADEAVEAFRRMAELGSSQTYGYLGHAYAVAGRRAEAEAVLRDLVDRRARSGPDAAYAAWNLALVHVGLGERERALDWLEEAFAERSNLFVYAGVLPHWDPLRDHPRFRALIRQVGLTSAPITPSQPS